MGIGTRSKSHQGECIGNVQSSRVTVDSGTNEKGTTSSTNDNTNNQPPNSSNNPNNPLSSVNPNVNDKRLGKQSKTDQNVEDGTGPSSGSVAANSSGNTGTNSTSSTGNNTTPSLVTRTRGCKRPKREPSPPGSPNKKVAKEVKTATPEAKKRQWELWTVDEKSTFFQALNECGRDFVAIQNNFAQKYKKNGAPALMIKNKEQVRHFYYRTWHKISKHIELKDGIKKHALEVYGLIHYGEMRKRLGGMRADKNLHKLNEFIQEGSTLIKIRRRGFRIRTPYCNALKKINNVEDPVEDDDSACRVPERVTLELNPKNNSAWLHVQEMAQNPRLRMTLKSDQHLSTVMTFLQKKWKPPRLKLKESLNSFDEIQKQLVLYPHRSSKCYSVSLQAIETQPRPDLKLNNYHANIKDAVLSDSSRLDVAKDDASVANRSVKEPKTSLTISGRNFIDIGSDNAMFPDVLMSLPSNVLDKPSETPSILQSTGTTGTESSAKNSKSGQSAEIQPFLQPSATTNTTAVVTTSTVATANSTASAADVSAAEELEKIKRTLLEQSRRGWTLEEAEDLTVAQLFLIFGKEGLIRLEYDWSKSSADSKEELYDCYAIINRLRRLVHLATMEFTDYVKVKAPKPNEKPKSGKSNTGCEVCEACGKILNQSDSKANSKLANKNVNKNTQAQNNAKNATVYKESCGNSENTAKCPPVKKVDKTKVNNCERVDGVFRVPVIPGRGPLSQTLIPNEYINQYNRPRHRRKLQRSAKKPVFLQRTLLPKENPGIMTLALLPAVTPVTMDGSFLSVNNRTNAMITTRSLSSFSNTYTTPVLTQPIASTLSMHSPNNPVIIQGTVSQQPAGIAVITTTTATTITASTGVTNSTNTESTKTETSSSDMSTLLNTNSCSTDSSSLSTAPLSTSPKTGSSPLNISTLFDLSLSDIPMPILDGSESKGPSTDSGLITPPLHTEYRLQTSPYNSPFKFSSDNAWMLGEMGDISLGSLLGDSPIKKNLSADGQHHNIIGTSNNNSNSNSSISGSLTLNSLFNDWSRDSSTSRMDLDTTLQMIMNENSMDYVSKFAELAERVAASDAAAVRAAKITSENNDVNAQDSTNCTNTDDYISQLNDNLQ